MVEISALLSYQHTAVIHSPSRSHDACPPLLTHYGPSPEQSDAADSYDDPSPS